VSDPQANVSTSWRTSEIQFTKVEPLLRAQKAADLQKSEAALRELLEKGIELYSIGLRLARGPLRA
jgi:hypothetical protein